MVICCPDGVVHGYDVELGVVLEGCNVMLVNASISEEAVTLHSVWSDNALLLLYIPF